MRSGNALLREYYLERYHELHGDRGAFPTTGYRGPGPMRGQDPMAERFVDWNVEHFMQELEEKLAALKTHLAQLRSLHDQALMTRRTESPDLRNRLKEAAENVGKQADSLGDMIAIVTIDMRGNGKKAIENVNSSDRFLENELEFLEMQAFKAEKHINALFLVPTHTVTVAELQGDNVLTQLRSIELLAKEIRKHLEIGKNL